MSVPTENTLHFTKDPETGDLLLSLNDGDPICPRCVTLHWDRGKPQGVATIHLDVNEISGQAPVVYDLVCQVAGMGGK